MAVGYFQKEMIRMFSRDVIKYECERRNIHQSEPTIPQATVWGEINATELGNILPSKYMVDGKEYWTHRYIRDEWYKLTSFDEIRRFLKWNLVNNNNYTAEYYDCDNFSMQLAADAQVWSPGIAFGIMDVPGHSKNMFVTNDRKVYQVEPQSDAISAVTSQTQVTFYLI